VKFANLPVLVPGGETRLSTAWLGPTVQRGEHFDPASGGRGARAWHVEDYRQLRILRLHPKGDVTAAVGWGLCRLCVNYERQLPLPFTRGSLQFLIRRTPQACTVRMRRRNSSNPGMAGYGSSSRECGAGILRAQALRAMDRSRAFPSSRLSAIAHRGAGLLLTTPQDGAIAPSPGVAGCGSRPRVALSLARPQGTHHKRPSPCEGDG
jgi:hypothetical protein